MTEAALKPKGLGKFKNLNAMKRNMKLSLGLPVPIINGQLPWGYRRDETDPQIAVIIEPCRKIIHRAKDFLLTDSYVDVSNWLKSCGYPLSQEGLRRLMMDRPPFDEIMLPLEERLQKYHE